MNVYDFDETIFHPDCTAKFALYCAVRQPSLFVTYLPRFMKVAYRYKKGKVQRYEFELTFFSFLPMVKEFDRKINDFWDKNYKNISSWYMAQKKPDDLIISASPDCIIAPIAERLGVNHVASEYDREYGVLCGNLMLAQSKAEYIIKQGMPVIENFYSDSLSDTPIALCAENAFLVLDKAQRPVPWPKLTKENLEKISKQIDIGWEDIDD